MKKIMFSLVLMLVALFTLPMNGEANTGKIGILFSDQNETYMDSTNIGGSYKPPHFDRNMTVSPKVDYSSSLDKASKLYMLYKEEGYNVHKLSDKDLNNLNALNEYDVIVLANTVMLSHTQRENIKAYVYGGGNAQFLFATARNELAKYQKDPKKMDLSPMIYDVLTYIWEWDNLTETLQSRFVDDVVLTDGVITNKAGSTHPILTNAYKKLGKNSIQLKESGAEWIESVTPWPTSNAQTILTYANFSKTDKPKNITKNVTPALLAIEHGAGRVVYSTFKIYDYIGVKPGDMKWVDNSTANQAYTNTSGEKDAEAVLTSSIDWLLAGSQTFAQRKYDVALTPANLTANITPQKKFALRGSVTAKNNGNVPARGYLKVEVLNKNGSSLGSYRKLLTGLAPGNTADSSYLEKFEILIDPAKIPNGTYDVRITFEETRHDRQGDVTRAALLKMTRNNNYGSYTNFTGFKDVGSGSHTPNILNAAKIGIITGYTDGTFNPLATISRYHAALMTLRAMGVAPSASATMPATDLPKNDFKYATLATAYNLGLISLEEGKINANAPMRRGAMAQALVKGFNLVGTSTMPLTDITPSYEQYNNISTLYHHRVTTGVTATEYKPFDAVTRGQFASFVMRSLENSQK